MFEFSNWLGFLQNEVLGAVFFIQSLGLGFSENFQVLVFDFQIRVSVSQRVSDFAIRQP